MWDIENNILKNIISERLHVSWSINFDALYLTLVNEINLSKITFFLKHGLQFLIQRKPEK